MTRGSSEAERLRHCRETFALALASGTTMEAARRELVRRRWAEADARLARVIAAVPSSPAPPLPIGSDAPWMMRD